MYRTRPTPSPCTRPISPADRSTSRRHPRSSVGEHDRGTAWDRFRGYMFALGESQATDPWFNDVVSLRYPEATALREICDRAAVHGETLLRAAQADDALRRDCTAADLNRLIWLSAQAVRLGDDWWRRALDVFLDGLRA